MTIEEIIKEKQERLNYLEIPENWKRMTKNMECGEYKEFRESCIADEICIQALKEKQERDNPKPLTIDELKQMDGESVWVVEHADENYYCGAALVDVLGDEDSAFRVFSKDVEWIEGQDDFSCYRYKPKEVQA